MKVKHADFLNLDPRDPSFSKVILKAVFVVTILPVISNHLITVVFLLNISSILQVRAILLDPSCSGSGTAFERLDHLLPSHTAGDFWSSVVGSANFLYFSFIFLCSIF